MQKLMMLAVLAAGLSLILPLPSGANPTCGVNDAGQTTCVVNVTGRGSATDCNASDEAFPTIQRALDSLDPTVGPDIVAPSRIILVCPGTYDIGGQADPEAMPPRDCTNILGTECTSRVGIGINAVTIVSTDGPHVTQISGAFSYGFIINAHHVTIEGFTVVGGTSEPGGTENIGIFMHRGRGNRVLNNVVRKAFIGICVSGAPDQDPNIPVDLSNIVQGNWVHQNKDGIVLSSDIPRFPPLDITSGTVGCLTGIIDRSIITNNTVKDNHEHGIVVYQGVRNSLVGNTVHDNRTGIAIPSLEAIFTIVEANSVQNNDTGIVENGNDTRCHGNNIQGNDDGDLPRRACASEDNQLPYIR